MVFLFPLNTQPTGTGTLGGRHRHQSPEPVRPNSRAALAHRRRYSPSGRRGAGRGHIPTPPPTRLQVTSRRMQNVLLPLGMSGKKTWKGCLLLGLARPNKDWCREHSLEECCDLLVVGGEGSIVSLSRAPVPSCGQGISGLRFGVSRLFGADVGGDDDDMFPEELSDDNGFMSSRAPPPSAPRRKLLAGASSSSSNGDRPAARGLGAARAAGAGGVTRDESTRGRAVERLVGRAGGSSQSSGASKSSAAKPPAKARATTSWQEGTVGESTLAAARRGDGGGKTSAGKPGGGKAARGKLAAAAAALLEAKLARKSKAAPLAAKVARPPSGSKGPQQSAARAVSGTASSGKDKERPGKAAPAALVAESASEPSSESDGAEESDEGAEDSDGVAEAERAMAQEAREEERAERRRRRALARGEAVAEEEEAVEEEAAESLRGNALVTRRVRVLWDSPEGGDEEDDVGRWYVGVVKSFGKTRGHCVEYDDKQVSSSAQPRGSSGSVPAALHPRYISIV